MPTKDPSTIAKEYAEELSAAITKLYPAVQHKDLQLLEAFIDEPTDSYSFLYTHPSGFYGANAEMEDNQLVNITATLLSDDLFPEVE